MPIPPPPPKKVNMQPEEFRLIITHNMRTGMTNASGPIKNKGLCYMLLELGRDTIKEYHDNPKNKSLIEVPSIQVSGRLK